MISNQKRSNTRFQFHYARCLSEAYFLLPHNPTVWQTKRLMANISKTIIKRSSEDYRFLYIRALFLNFQYWYHWLVYVCGLLSREAFWASHSLITWRSPYPGDFFNLLFISLIITALEFLMGCGRIFFYISKSAHYALPNRVYLLHISRQAFFTKKLRTYSHFWAYLLLKISININCTVYRSNIFLFTYFFF